MLAPAVRLRSPEAVVGSPVVDTRSRAVGLVVGAELGRGRTLAALLVRAPDGGTLRIEEARIVAFDAGRVLVRSA